MLTVYRKLGELLVEHEVINNLQLSIALAAQQTSSRRLGEILVERGFATEDQIAQCLAQQYNYPLADLEIVRPEPEALALFTVEMALEWRALPLSVSRTQLSLAIADPIDYVTTDEISERFDRRLQLYIAPESKLRETILNVYGLSERKAVPAEQLGGIPSRFANPIPRRQVGGVNIFDAHDNELNRPVSLFAISTSDSDHANHWSNVRAVASAASTHICPIHDSFEESGTRWTVTPPTKGETLEHLLRTRGRRTVAQACEMVASLALGVDAINQQSGGCGLVCPANVLIGPEGPVLAPFAKPAPVYLAPELKNGGSATPQSDCFSLGVLLLEAISGVTPKLLNQPERHFGDIPPGLEELLSKCLAADPSLRISSAVQLASELKSFDWTVISRQPEQTSMMSERDALLRGLTVSEPRSTSLWQRWFGKGQKDKVA